MSRTNKERRKSKRRFGDMSLGSGECIPEDCSAHKYIELAVRNLEKIAEKLTEGQFDIKINLTRLTANMESVTSLHGRMDKLEFTIEEIRKSDKAQDKTLHMYVGGMAVITFVCSLGATVFFR